MFVHILSIHMASCVCRYCLSGTFAGKCKILIKLYQLLILAKTGILHSRMESLVKKDIEILKKCRKEQQGLWLR